MFVILLYSLIVLYLLNRYLNRKFSYFDSLNIPTTGPQSFFEFVIQRFFKSNSFRDFNLQTYQNLKDYPVGGYYGIGVPFFSISDLEIVKDIFVRDFDHFTDRFHHSYRTLPLMEINLFFANGRKWRVARKLLTPVFTSGKIKGMDQIVLGCTQDMEKYLKKNIESNQEFDIKNLFKRYTLNVIAQTAFGIEPDEKILEELDQFDALSLKTKIIFYLASLFLPNFMQKLVQIPLITPTAYHMILQTVRNEIDFRQKNGKKRQDFLQHIIDIIENPENKNIDKEAIFSQTILFLLAGFETSNTVLSFALFEMALNPDIQTKVRDEIREALAKNGNVWSYEILKHLKYLELIFLETLRKYPPLPRLERYCVKDYKIKESNLFIKHGDHIACSVIGFHYDSQYFSNPTEFNPLRFEEDRNPPGFFPFGIGPRDCIGKRFAVMSIQLSLAYLLNSFQFRTTENTPKTIKYYDIGLLLKAKNQLWIKVEEITN